MHHVLSIAQDFLNVLEICSRFNNYVHSQNYVLQFKGVLNSSYIPIIVKCELDYLKSLWRPWNLR